MDFESWSLRFDSIIDLIEKEFRSKGWSRRLDALTTLLYSHCIDRYDIDWNYGF